MNLLVLTSIYPEPDDGEDIVTPTVKYFCEKWVEQGHRVIVIHSNTCFPRVFYYVPKFIRKKMESILGHNFPTRSSRMPLVWKENGVHINRLPMEKIIPHGGFSKGTITLQINRIKNVLKKESFKPDIIMAHWVNPQLDLITELKKEYKCKTSLVFHGDCSEHNINKFRIKEKIKNVDSIGCRNRFYAEIVQRDLCLENPPFICCSGIPDKAAIYMDRRLKKGINFINNNEFIYVGRLVRYKNVDIIIKALHRCFPNKDFILHVVGDGAEKENLTALAKRLGIEDCVFFHGQVSRVDVFSMMQKAKFFVMVSNNETYGMVYIEAMLAGCITIASKGCGVDGIIKDNENGFLCNQGDVVNLINLITYINSMKEKDINIVRVNAIKEGIRYSDWNVAKNYLNCVK